MMWKPLKLRFLMPSLWNRHQSAKETSIIGYCFGYSCCNGFPEDSYHLLPAKENIQITRALVCIENVGFLDKNQNIS